jgi:hypothetical protein
MAEPENSGTLPDGVAFPSAIPLILRRPLCSRLLGSGLRCSFRGFDRAFPPRPCGVSSAALASPPSLKHSELSARISHPRETESGIRRWSEQASTDGADSSQPWRKPRDRRERRLTWQTRSASFSTRVSVPLAKGQGPELQLRELRKYAASSFCLGKHGRFRHIGW